MIITIDTEFIENGSTIDLISIGMVKENGEEFYRVSTEFDASKASQWVVDNVYPKLVKDGKRIEPEIWKSRKEIKEDLLEFVGKEEIPEFWAFYCNYDWVALCQLFGTMIDLPEYFPKFCHELKMLANEKGNPKGPIQENEHHALNDAKWDMKYYNQLKNINNEK